MFKRREIERLSQKCTELGEQLKSSKQENQILRKKLENKTSDYKDKNVLLIDRIQKLVTGNKYGKEKVILDKIRELVQTHKKQTNSHRNIF